MTLSLLGLLAAIQYGGQVGSTFGGDGIGPLVGLFIFGLVLFVVWSGIVAVCQWLGRVLRTLFKRT